jgi:hypothetical protein
MTLMEAVLSVRENDQESWDSTVSIWCSDRVFRRFIRSHTSVTYVDAELNPPLLLGRQLKPFLREDKIVGRNGRDEVVWVVTAPEEG